MIEPRPDEPALTEAEYELLDRYVAVLRLVGRLNPGRTRSSTRACMNAAALLAVESAHLRDAFAIMLERGEEESHASTLARGRRGMEAERHAERAAPL